MTVNDGLYSDYICITTFASALKSKYYVLLAHLFHLFIDSIYVLDINHEIGCTLSAYVHDVVLPLRTAHFKFINIKYVNTKCSNNKNIHEITKIYMDSSYCDV